MKPVNIYKCKENNATLVQLNCNEEPFESLEKLETDKANGDPEKHVPVLECTGDTLRVKVGKAPHPMTPQHYIEWILVQTDDGGLYRTNTPDDLPEAVFTLSQEKIVRVYAYCNIHGLWEAEQTDSDLDLEEIVCSAEFSDTCMDA
ncbi:MAG: desulfoferrodoxin family protein [Christensenella sp.]|uniref:desulfoferrodoxin family protein n=1 Tax=Christensenella sp. TaxID=1935934 RepID=UPI002B1F8FDC|nr:desulfoferrodoxin family protein [Christensenella sp.]MEA5002934.1 desulfoferrodoxin family protein [Christensenella sp.]